LVNVEKLTLAMGSSALQATGNDLNNTLTGNEGANTLNGGKGRDTMAGGAGDDHYFVDNIYDVVTETVLNTKGGGIDTVESSVTYSLAARANVDHLVLTGGNAINGTGNALNNEITGNDFANRLDGGAGNDRLVGNDGKDTGDIISGFVKGAGGDILNLADLIFGIGAVGVAFSGGYLDFEASGSNTLLRVDQNGGGDLFTTYLTLNNVALTEADTQNIVLA
jgi:Ca2+-binding RTX toxin-like protein